MQGILWVIYVYNHICSEQSFQVEYGPPKDLLKSENGLLRSLVNDSADKEHLLCLAAGSA